MDLKIIHSDRKVNCLRWRPNESWSHVLKKTEVCYWLRSQGITFYTETTFTTGGRADILAVGKVPYIIEIIESEKELKKHKKELYPFEIIVIKANKQFNPEMLQ